MQVAVTIVPRGGAPSAFPITQPPECRMVGIGILNLWNLQESGRNLVHPSIPCSGSSSAAGFILATSGPSSTCPTGSQLSPHLQPSSSSGEKPAQPQPPAHF